MSEHDSGTGDRVDPDDTELPLESPPRPEGVRIIGAEEAAAALETGQVGTRRPEDAPRFGDRPAAPSGPRPRHRFPLTDPEDDLDEPTDTVATAPELPHWTEPATGEVPRILASDPPPEEDEDSAAWQTFTGRAPRWRDQQADWAATDFDDVSSLSDEIRVGALDDTRSEVSDLYSFEEDPLPTPPPTPPPGTPAVRTRPQPRRAPVGPPNQAEPASERNVITAVATGVAIAVLAAIVFRSGRGATLALAVAIVTVAAVELFDGLRRSGYRPATLLGLTATISVMLAAYHKGETAIPLVFALTMLCSLLWYLLGVTRARPTVNVAATLLGFTWVGFLGSFASLILRLPHGISFLLGAVLATVAYDIGGFFVGSRSGRTPLAPNISPNKTWEGLFGGAGAAILVSVVVTRAVFPWTLGSALALGLVVAVVAPLGDLCESMVKRDLGIKDMGTILPGHGGIFDRFDALLFVLPATYYLVQLLSLA